MNLFNIYIIIMTVSFIMLNLVSVNASTVDSSDFEVEPIYLHIDSLNFNKTYGITVGDTLSVSFRMKSDKPDSVTL